MNPPWHQVHIQLDPWEHAEHTAVTHLAPLLAEAEVTGLITSWFFTRKAPCWHLRLLPTADANSSDTKTFVHQGLEALHQTDRITRWVETIYEPETHAFGGPAAMDTAHRLFHQDSRHTLTYLATVLAHGGDKRRELSILLCSLLMRSASQDWYEQGDIWARVVEHRALPPDIPQHKLQDLQPDLRRLMTVDTAALLRDNGPLASMTDWAAAYDHAGTELRDLALSGTLQRGLRAVLAHHVIFAWNRIGLPHTAQTILANAAKAVILDR